uniref:Octapeptide-repeat protein T2 n=1 Tax=Strongyloides stercoralis TaxID=6248 RepID=A0A0K0E1L6_STRER
MRYTAILENGWESEERVGRGGEKGEKEAEEKRENCGKREEDEKKKGEKRRKHEKRREHVKYQGEESRTASRFELLLKLQIVNRPYFIFGIPYKIAIIASLCLCSICQECKYILMPQVQA